ncbi:MAG: serine/threonine protein kinase, partial [Gemmatimonadetes bacterium]|nr:serine/threonine protein kinase [Gemmatimonadota bacterium]
MISGDDPRDAVVGSAGAPTRADRPAEPPSSPATMVCPSCAGEYGPEVRFCPRDGAVLRAKARSADLSGLVVGGRYRVHRRLGAGGMGTVYLAEHVRMGRRCALKVLSRALSEDAEAASRFAREAANASRVSHPNVATVYDFGETDDGLIYLAMEYVEGEPLSRLVEREGRLPAERAVGIACQIATGLAAAHRAGVVHRDLKPDNVLVAVGEDGGDLVKVIDFGIAKAAHDAEQDLTRTGFVVGTPRYMSPEQLVGEPADGRSDLYALGCILFEMLTGDAPWGGATPAGVTRRLTEAPPHPRALDPRIPVALDGAIVRLLAREREERYPGAEAAAAALARAVGWPGPATRRDASPVPVAPVGGGGAGRS